MAAFNDAVNKVLGDAIEVSNARGEVYQDTWHTDNVKTTFLDSALRVVEGDHSAEAKRIIIAAVLCDVKVSRFIGQWHSDNGVDLINYMAAFTHWMDEYRAPSQR